MLPNNTHMEFQIHIFLLEFEDSGDSVSIGQEHDFTACHVLVLLPDAQSQIWFNCRTHYEAITLTGCKTSSFGLII